VGIDTGTNNYVFPRMFFSRAMYKHGALPLDIRLLV
jgi:hypothetical protein